MVWPRLPGKTRSPTRLVREARAIYNSIFPPTDAVSAPPDDCLSQGAQPGASDPIAFCKLAAEGE
jgi:hypothetical protein